MQNNLSVSNKLTSQISVIKWDLIFSFDFFKEEAETQITGESFCSARCPVVRRNTKGFHAMPCSGGLELSS